MEQVVAPPHEANASDFSKRDAMLILIVLVLLNIFNYMDRSVLNVAMESIKLEFSLTDGQLGAMQSIFLIGVGVLILPAGFLVDRSSRKFAVMTMGFVWSAATILTGVAGGFVVLMLARFICGAGEAGFNPGGTAWLSIAFEPKHRAIVNSIFAVGATVGILLGNILGGLIITKTGQWHMPFVIFGVVGIVFSCFVFFLKDVKAPPRPATVKQASAAVETKMLFEKKTLLWISMAQGLFAAASMGLAAWMPTMLIRLYNLSAVEAGAVFSSMIIPALISPVVGGWLADRFARKTPIGRPLFAMIAGLLSALAIWLKVYYAGEVALTTFVIIMVVSSFFGALQSATYQAINMDVFIPSQRGKAAAMAGMITFLGFTWWGPGLIGFASDAFGGGNAGLRYALMLMVPICILSSVCAWIACGHYRKERLAEENVAVSPMSNKEHANN